MARLRFASHMWQLFDVKYATCGSLLNMLFSTNIAIELRPQQLNRKHKPTVLHERGTV